LKPLNPTIRKTRPIIKWTGGKYNEFPAFEKYIPAFDNYYEPFFGGGGVFFALQPKGKSYLNDKSKDLFDFYSLLQSKELKKQLLVYADAWGEAGKLSSDLLDVLSPLFSRILNNELDVAALQIQIEKVLQNEQHIRPLLFSEEFIVQPGVFFKKLVHSVTDKMRRITAIAKKENRTFETSELPEHIETGIKSGLYLFLRSITNSYAAGQVNISKEKAVANWYFVREFCYASMFRFNAKGEFNIPYGGIAYNRKDFRQKVENIFTENIQQLFKSASFTNLDFQEFLIASKPTNKDFIFVDPPYDSEFSEYDQNAFTKDDQVRLRDVLIASPAKWMMVIKETEFIRNLYDKHCTLLQFDKTYTYNVRGRNNRDTKHLIIINYEL
jgi:DNA adenine methylase